MDILDRLYAAEQDERGLRLSKTDVADLVEEIEELQLQRELDAIDFDRLVTKLTGEPSKILN